MKRIDFNTLKIGDKVYSNEHGEGVVEGINKVKTYYPIIVKFEKENCHATFSSTGNFQFNDKYPNYILI